VLSLELSLFTTQNSISPLRSSITAGCQSVSAGLDSRNGKGQHLLRKRHYAHGFGSCCRRDEIGTLRVLDALCWTTAVAEIFGLSFWWRCKL